MEKIADYGAGFRPETLLKYDQGWIPPNTDELREAKRKSAKTGAELGTMFGVDGRTIRKWIGGERKIPYAAWRLWLYAIREIGPNDLI